MGICFEQKMIIIKVVVLLHNTYVHTCVFMYAIAPLLLLFIAVGTVDQG